MFCQLGSRLLPFLTGAAIRCEIADADAAILCLSIIGSIIQYPCVVLQRFEPIGIEEGAIKHVLIFIHQIHHLIQIGRRFC